MELLHFNAARCDLCGECIKKCPFSALSMGEEGIEVNAACRMCGVCVKSCPQEAIRFEQKAGTVDKKEWKDILIYAEQENGQIHPVVYELIGEAKKLAENVGYKVHAVLVGDEGTKENAKKLIPYGVERIFVYEHAGFCGFKADCYTDALADCISTLKPSVVLVGATSTGRSLAPRLSTRFHTGLTADCTKLMMKENTDLVQIRPAFGGNVMAQILITNSRPQFATVRYKVMDKAKKVQNPVGRIEICPVSDELVKSAITVQKIQPIEHKRSIEEEDVLVVAGRGVTSDQDMEILCELTKELGGQLCFTRPMVEEGYGDTAHQIGLSGRTVKPKLILTFGVSGAIQFTACMNSAECIVSINNDPGAQIFDIAHYCINGDVSEIAPALLKQVKKAKEEQPDAISL
ncbi:MAG: electron transfer flavoprotein subunit alpha [Lachnospiraceae bacterium]|nr:electron transfer flavoprotein subunit alpha [Lachnospiraceae bacterium]